MCDAAGLMGVSLPADHGTVTMQAGGNSTDHSGPAHLACPFCASYDVDRLFLASTRIDCCECTSCGARWDENSVTGEYLGRTGRASVLVRRV